MSISKTEILSKIGYTELVYTRINKKLKSNLSKSEIELNIIDSIKSTDDKNFQKIGKNIYITNIDKNLKTTVNSSTYRVITVDRISKN